MAATSEAEGVQFFGDRFAIAAEYFVPEDEDGAIIRPGGPFRYGMVAGVVTGGYDDFPDRVFQSVGEVDV